MSSISQSIRQQVVSEAKQCCEYCMTQQLLIGMPLVIDHVIPRSTGGSDKRENLAASCYRCNEFKGARTQAPDPMTGEQAPLFNPRQQIWSDHFAWTNAGTHIAGLTATGRATVETLKLNNDYIVEARKIWVAQNWHPPEL